MIGAFWVHEELQDDCVNEDWEDCGRRYHESFDVVVLTGLEVNGVTGDNGETGEESGELPLWFMCRQSSR